MTEEMIELQELKDKADLLGVKYSASIKADSLRAKIKEHQEANAKPQEDKDSVAALRKKAYLEGRKLIRCIITPNQAEKAELPNEEFIVSNKYLGDVDFVVPYGVEYHVPKCIVDLLKSKRYVKAVKDQKDPYAMPSIQQLPMYSINTLDPLTEEELEQLNKDIAAQGRF